jgi:uncharacterized protein YecE (DUF72 family)
MKKLFIGTSGFSYPHWEKEVFYPKNLQKNKKLEYFSNCFNTVELNNSFYHLPKLETFSNWKERTPEEFIFSVKASRYITHVKKLKDCKEPWNNLLERAKHLSPKLGPFLFQFPSSWRKNVKRFKDFLSVINKDNSDLKFAFEFRHLSWFSSEIYNIFKDYNNMSLCISDSPAWPSVDKLKGSFVYIRMHGRNRLYGSSYTKEELKNLARKVNNYLDKESEVYCYFNNDAKGYAVKNAKELLSILKE